MSRKQCRRKVWGLVNPITHAIDGASITPGHLLDCLRLVELSAIESFTSGRATKEDWKALADLVNVAETMADGGVGPEVLEFCQRAQQGLSEARERYERTNRMGLSGPAIQAMRDLHEYHDLQRTSIPRGEYERFIQKTRNRILSAHPSLKATV
jgi:hypothetical protein